MRNLGAIYVPTLMLDAVGFPDISGFPIELIRGVNEPYSFPLG